jgi:hypothetical protein
MPARFCLATGSERYGSTNSESVTDTSMTSKHLRIALLLCDTPIPAVVATHGDYHVIFSDLLKASLPENATFILDPYDVVHKQEYPPDNAEYDGILITGSGKLELKCEIGLPL